MIITPPSPTIDEAIEAKRWVRLVCDKCTSELDRDMVEESGKVVSIIRVYHEVDCSRIRGWRARREYLKSLPERIVP